MGIVNVTPDSFYDGGLYLDVDCARARAASLLENGADIIDIGAESTRPGATPVPWRQECERLLPALEAIASLPGAIISVDTRNAKTAAVALENGCAVINDISACRHDPGLLDVLVQYKPGYVLMHSRGEPGEMQANPRYGNVVEDVAVFFEASLNRLVSAGLPEDRIALDVGIGFGKKLEHNLELLATPERFLEFGRPLLIGVSNKSMFGDLLGLAPHKRGPATAALTSLLFRRGFQWHRVHDVKAAGMALARGVDSHPKS